MRTFYKSFDIQRALEKQKKAHFYLNFCLIERQYSARAACQATTILAYGRNLASGSNACICAAQKTSTRDVQLENCFARHSVSLAHGDASAFIHVWLRSAAVLFHLSD